MAAETAPQKRRTPRRRWSPAEKRRIVELTLRAGASVRAIAAEHGVTSASLYQWKGLHRAGKLNAQANSAAGTTFVPVTIVPAVRKVHVTRPDTRPDVSDVVQLVFTSGATLRIETSTLDAAFVCALIAELQR